ncbi:MAG: VWA domain-containing protein, partial [Planctomycetes bacterium]|nr:VWA domain-containing protein [Planctomycetota bacterium]
MKKLERKNLACFLIGALVLLTALSPFSSGAFGAEESAGRAGLGVSLINDDLGDPHLPHNFKISMRLPEAIRASVRDISAENFGVFVYPKGTADEEMTEEKYRSFGLMLWKHGTSYFLDIRKPPVQNEAGEYGVLVRFSAGGEVLAEGHPAANVRYTPGKADVVLMIDSSQSMIRSDPRKRRVDAAKAFLDMAHRGGRIGSVAIVTFDNYATVRAPLTPLSERDELLRKLSRVPSSGMTNMDRALDEAFSVLETSKAGRKAVVLLTDGKNEPLAYADTHLRFAEKSIPVFTIGLSEYADSKTLKKMADDTGGRFMKASADRDLISIYQRLASEIGKRVVMITERIVYPDVDMSISVDDSVRSVSFILDSGDEQAIMALGSPAGESLDDGEKVSSVHDKTYQMSQVIAPASGKWSVKLGGASRENPYELTVTADTDLFLDLFPPQLDGRKLAVGATIAAGKTPLSGGRVRLFDSKGVPLVELMDDGTHGDGKADDGVFSGSFVLPDDFGGDLAMELRAWGATGNKQDYVRQASAAIKNIEKVEAEPEPKIADRLIIDGIKMGTAIPGETVKKDAKLVLISSGGRDVRVKVGGLADGEHKIPALEVYVSLPTGAVIQPGDTAFSVRVAVPEKTLPGIYSGSITVIAGEAEKEIPLKLDVAQVALGLDSDKISFGDIEPGNTVSKSIPVGLDSPRDLELAWKADSNDISLSGLEKGRLKVGPDNAVAIAVRAPLDSTPGKKKFNLTLGCGPAKRTIEISYNVPNPPYESLPVAKFPVPKPEKAPVPIPEFPGLPEDKAAPEKIEIPELAKAEPANTMTPQPSAVPPAMTDKKAAEDTWRGMRSYLIWMFLLLLLILIICVFVVRAAVKERMARFAALSLLIHAIIFLVFANYVVIVEPQQMIIEQPRMMAKLVSIKRDLGMELSEAEQQLLNQVESIDSNEKRFTAMDSKAEEEEGKKESEAVTLDDIQFSRIESREEVEREEEIIDRKEDEIERQEMAPEVKVEFEQEIVKKIEQPKEPIESKVEIKEEPETEKLNEKSIVASLVQPITGDAEPVTEKLDRIQTALNKAEEIARKLEEEADRDPLPELEMPELTLEPQKNNPQPESPSKITEAQEKEILDNVATLTAGIDKRAPVVQDNVSRSATLPRNDVRLEVANVAAKSPIERGETERDAREIDPALPELTEEISSPVEPAEAPS